MTKLPHIIFNRLREIDQTYIGSLNDVWQENKVSKSSEKDKRVVVVIYTFCWDIEKWRVKILKYFKEICLSKGW